MKIQITIEFKQVDKWNVNWNDPKEQDFLFYKLSNAVSDKMDSLSLDKIKIKHRNIKVSKPIIYKPWKDLIKL